MSSKLLHVPILITNINIVTFCKTAFAIHCAQHYTNIHVFNDDCRKIKGLHTLYNHVLKRRPGVGHVPLLPTFSKRGGNPVRVVQTSTTLHREKETQYMTRMRKGL